MNPRKQLEEWKRELDDLRKYINATPDSELMQDCTKRVDNLTESMDKAQSLYYVVNWNTKEQIGEPFQVLAKAKRTCRKLGHDAEPWGKWYGPVAFVASLGLIGDRGQWFVEYNPRFKVPKELQK